MYAEKDTVKIFNAAVRQIPFRWSDWLGLLLNGSVFGKFDWRTSFLTSLSTVIQQSYKAPKLYRIANAVPLSHATVSDNRLEQF